MSAAFDRRTQVSKSGWVRSGQRTTKNKKHKKKIQTSCREIDMVIHLKDDGWVNKCCERRAARSLAARRDRRRTRLVRTGQEVQIAVGVDISLHRVLLNEQGLVKKKFLHLILQFLFRLSKLIIMKSTKIITLFLIASIAMVTYIFFFKFP